MNSQRKRLKIKGRRTTGTFILIPHSVYDSPNFTCMSAHARRALLDFARRYNGRNNGDLALTWKMAHRAGWKSRETLENAIAELVHFGLFVRTRQGGLNLPNLYAMTWKEIDHCNGKLEMRGTNVPGNEWNAPKPAFCRTGKSKRQHAQRDSPTRQSGQSTSNVRLN